MKFFNFKIKNEELRYYLRDIFIFLIFSFAGVLSAEIFYFSNKEETNIVTKLEIYLFFIFPFFIIALILLYLYRNKRNLDTGRIKSSIRYRLTLAFIFVSLLPSIPVFLLSSNITGKVLETFYGIDVSNALNSAYEIVLKIEEKEKKSILLTASKLNKLVHTKNLNPYEFVQEAMKLGMDDTDKYYIGFYDKNYNILLETKKLKIKPEFQLFDYNNEFNLATNTIHTREKTYIFVRLDKKDNGFILLGKSIHNGDAPLVYNIIDVKNNYNTINLWKDKIPSNVRLSISIFFIIMFLISIIISFLFARKISRPIIRLAQATQAVSSGDTNISLDFKEEGEMGILIDSFNQMVKDLRQKNEELLHIQRIAAWKEMAQRIAHEIKNPLTPIQLSAERIRKKIESNSNPEKLKEIVFESTETIIGQVKVLEHLVKEFSEFARMPAPTLVNQDIHPVIEESIGLFKENTDIQFELKFAKRLPEVYIDRRLFIGVLNNLIKNAIEAIESREINKEKPKMIRIETKLKKKVMNRYVIVKVEDSGDGIPVEIRKKIFEPYFSTKEKHGSGLGLAVVQKTIIDHQGHITVAKSELGGSCFTIELPVSRGGMLPS